MSKKWMVPVVGLALAGSLILTQSWAADNGGSTAADVGKPAPDFTLKDTFGKEFKLSDFKGKVIVLEWINQDCPVSKGKHVKRVMQDTYKKYAAQDVVWLAIDTTDGVKPEKNRVYAAEQSLAYPILHDVDGKVGKAYDAKTTPHMYIVDKTGVLAYNGAIDDQGSKNFVGAALDDLIAGRTVASAKTRPYGCTVKYPRAR